MKPRSIRIDGDIAFVPLTRGREAIIDAADAELIGKNNWSLKVDGRMNFYAVRGIKRGGKCFDVRMHRVLLTAKDSQHVDHINGNGLDNRRSNLRIASVAENIRNSRIRSDNRSGLKGAAFHKASSKWKARIRIDGKDTYLGLFETREEAHAAYSDAAKRFFGEFARLA